MNVAGSVRINDAGKSSRFPSQKKLIELREFGLVMIGDTLGLLSGLLFQRVPFEVLQTPSQSVLLTGISNFPSIQQYI